MDRLVEIIAEPIRCDDEEHLILLAVALIDTPVSDLRTPSFKLVFETADIDTSRAAPSWAGSPPAIAKPILVPSRSRMTVGTGWRSRSTSTMPKYSLYHREAESRSVTGKAKTSFW
jgi:hypothetical protein